VIRYLDGTPAEVAEAAKYASEAAVVAKAYDRVVTVEKLYGKYASMWPMRWPKPRAMSDRSGKTFFHYEYCGVALSNAMFGPLTSDRKREELARRVFEGYPEFCRRLSVAWPRGDEPWDSKRIPSDISMDAELREDICGAITYARAKSWPTHSVHGDLSASNVMLDPNGQLVLIDWEGFEEKGLIALDLIRFYYDVVLESARWRKRRRTRFVSKMRELLHENLEKEGYRREEFFVLKNLFIADQLAFVGSKGREWSQLMSVRNGGFCFARGSISDR
jgi:hypothetical protein